MYAGKGRQARVAAAAVTRARLRKGSVTPTAADWDGLCAEVAAAGERRVMISSEAFCNAEADAVRRAVDGLGWATEAATAVAQEIVAGITATGTRVAGNLPSLATPSTPLAPTAAPAPAPVATLPAEAAAAALWGGLQATARKSPPAAARRPAGA